MSGIEQDRGFTLVDFINGLIKRWKLFVFIILLSLASGVLYSKTRPLQPFIFSTSLEIGKKEDNMTIEPLETVKAKLENAYIPAVLSQHATEQGYDIQRYWIDVQIPENSSTVLLQSQGYEAATDDILNIHKKITEIIIADHTELVANMKQKLQQDKLASELELESFKKEMQLLPRQKESINITTDIVKNQMQALQQLIENSENDRRHALLTAATKTSIDQSLATTFLLLDNTISQDRDKLRELEEKLFVQIPEKLKQVDREEFELLNKQKEQEQKISSINYQIENFRTTRILLKPSRLPRIPENSFLYQTIPIFTGVGFLVGLFLVAFVDFVSQIRKEKEINL